MGKRIVFFILIISCSLYAESFYDDFLKINNVFTENYGYIAKQSLIQIDSQTQEKKITNAFSLFCGNSEFTMLEKAKGLSILSTKSGYWIKNSKTKTPIKVSGSYVIDEIQMQDILRIDFKNDYQLIEKAEQTVLLARTNKKNSYFYFEISQKVNNDEKYYVVKALDSNKNVLKEIKYFPGNVSGLFCFYKIEVRNVILNSKVISIFVTEKFLPIKIPESLFKSEYVNELEKHVERYKNEL